MRVSEFEELATSYINKLTSIRGDSHIYMYAPADDIYEGVVVRLNIRQLLIPFTGQVFRFDSDNEAYSKPPDWYDLK